MSYMFYGCNNLTTLPQLDVSKVTNMGQYFRVGGGNLTDVGGWKNLKIDWNDNYGLVLCPKLTYQSCINILNGLYDFVGNGESTTKTLKVNQNFLTTVGDEISIGVAKGWTITA
jgi:surface protein